LLLLFMFTLSLLLLLGLVW